MAETIVPGVWGIPFGYVSAFAIAGDDGLTLIDSGLPGKANAIRRVLDAAAGPALRHVAITHHHMDHVGSLAEIAPDMRITVWAHGVDARVIRGDVAAPRPAGRNPIERGVGAVLHRFGPKAAPARVDREVVDGQELPIGGGLVAFHTPGHTAGHVSYLSPSKRVLFVGDAAARILGRLAPPIGVSTEDHKQVKTSIAKLAPLEFDVACFGHGRVLKGGAAKEFRKLAERIAG